MQFIVRAKEENSQGSIDFKCLKGTYFEYAYPKQILHHLIYRQTFDNITTTHA